MCVQLFERDHPPQVKPFADAVVFDPAAYEPAPLTQLGQGVAMGDIVEAKGSAVMALGRCCLALPAAPVLAYIDYGQLDRSVRIVSLSSTRAVLAWYIHICLSYS